MTFEEAIKHAEEVAEGHERIKRIKAVTLEDYKRLLEQEPCGLCKEDWSIITVPDGATNGDMIKALFGEPAKISEKSGVLYKFMYRNGRPMFSTFYEYDWWNSPYRKEQG